MNNPNLFFNKSKVSDDSIEVPWDTLKYVPFAGEKNHPCDARSEIRATVKELYKPNRKDSISAKEFLFELLDGIQPFLAQGNAMSLLYDYDYWKETLGEVGPILACFWAECDPALISYLFMIFIAQFLALLRLWSRVDFAPYCVKDCAGLGEFFLGVGLIQGDMLYDIIDRWKLNEEGHPSFLNV